MYVLININSHKNGMKCLVNKKIYVFNDNNQKITNLLYRQLPKN